MRPTATSGRGRATRSSIRRPTMRRPTAADCYLCPGNSRVHGASQSGIRRRSSRSTTTCHACRRRRSGRVAAAARHLPQPAGRGEGSRCLLQPAAQHRRWPSCRPSKFGDVLKCWQEQYRELGARPEVNHVLIFENKGKVVGVSNPHPHCQIYATNFVFKTIADRSRCGCAALASDHRPSAVRGHHCERKSGRPANHRRKRFGDRVRSVLCPLCL